MARRDYWIISVLAALGAAYAWWTQPYIGPGSLTSVLARSLMIAVWLGIFVAARNRRHDAWSWKRFAIGAAVGGGWLSLGFPMGETVTKSLAIISMGVVLGTVSGLFAALASTNLRAVMTGVGVFAAQLAAGLTVHALGWTKYSYGM